MWSVACYFGDLTAVVAAGVVCLRPTGLLGFTVEKAAVPDAPDGYHILCHGRYSHTGSYIRRVLTGAGLQPIAIETAVLRLERQEPVHGLVILAAKTAV
jgi:predicted TPR repeat methyltransferase